MNKTSEKENTINGLISITSKMIGFVTAVGFEEDIQIDPQFLNTALHGDEVEISLFPKVKGERWSGEIIKILKRAKTDFIGTVNKKKNGGFAFLIPDDRKMYVDIFIPPNEAKNIQNDYKALVRIKGWDDPKKTPEGTILKIIGKRGNNDVEMESIVLEKGFDTSFPPGVEKEAEIIKKKADTILKEEIKKRKDFRDVLTFTIDPYDAKDFDDAISFKKTQNEEIEIGIHIADVAHYVKEGGQLDKEARHRGTSIYLVDRTVPMLPEILSNDLCSLRPNEDKLAFSVLLTISSSGNIKKTWFGRTIIKSIKRFTYEEAQEILETKNGPYHEELSTLNKIAKIFTDKRMSAGAIDFEKEEIKFKLDEEGRPIEVIKKERKDAHRLVEEFMILANREVATYLSNEIKRINKGGSVYRIHGDPKKESVDEMLFLLRALGHKIEMKGQKISSKELNKILEKTRNKPEESLIKTVAMRSMAKAVYSTRNIGHYGLALENYTHFTSPIRRYADILVHRVLEKHLKGQSLSKSDVEWYHNTSISLSEREINATEAERASIAYKQVEFMLEKKGDIREGIISGITKWGVYIEESETKANGMVKFKDMKDDFYTFEKESYSIIGSRTKKKYTVGDKVKIKILGGDLVQKTLDYSIV